jgi:hypothetical protein
LANIRQIYPPEREALGVVAIGIQLVPRVGPVAPATREGQELSPVADRGSTVRTRRPRGSPGPPVRPPSCRSR